MAITVPTPPPPQEEEDFGEKSEKLLRRATAMPKNSRVTGKMAKTSRSSHQQPGPWAHPEARAHRPSGPLAKVTSLNSSMEISSPVGENHPADQMEFLPCGFIKHGWTTIFTWNVEPSYPSVLLVNHSH